MKKQFAVVGGSNVDIFATSALPLVSYDSNPGTVNIGFGGVGRNIAENLARLGQDVTLIAAFGGDLLSEQMFSHTAAAGVRMQHSPVYSDTKAPYYISVNDANGDMAVAVNDMQVCERITPALLSEYLLVINSCDAVILDTNIPRDSIAYLAENCTPPLFAEAVSTVKAMKLVPILPHLFALQTNLREAEALLGRSIDANAASLSDAAERLHKTGISYVLITLGKSGAFLSVNDQKIMLPAYAVDTINANGCGDSFGAAAFLGILQQEASESILHNALAAAAITARSAQAVSPEMSVTALHTLIHESRNTI